MRSPKLRQVLDERRIQSRTRAVLLEQQVQAVRLTAAGALPRIAKVRDDAWADVERRHRRTLRQPQTPKRVGERERLDHLHGVDVVALRLVDEVEPRADNGDAPDRTTRELAAIAYGGERLLEGKIDAHRRVGRETTVAIERRVRRALL